MAGLWVPSALASASERVPVAKPSSPRPAAHAYFGILGEVVCPGVYELPPGATFGQLVRRAGGITPDANGNSRVFRGGRVAQQLFVASSHSTILYPGDLILVEHGGGKPSPPKPLAAAPATQPTEVQLAFVNLVDRPVVVRMPRELASPARIVELLGQPAALVEDIRVVAPSRREDRRVVQSNSDADLLPTGSVLIFPPRRVRVASLPPLPDVITHPQSEVSLTSKTDPGDSAPKAPPRAETQIATPAAEPAPHSVESIRAPTGGPPSQEQIERLIYASRAGRSVSRMSGSTPSSRSYLMRKELEAEQSRPARPYVSFFVLAGAAALAMLFTIGSMTRRWINISRTRAQAQTACLVPPAPTLFAPEGAHRPLRVDANLPQTRLGIDLAIVERARARHAQGSATHPDPTPKAA
ncbi:MAG TPA: SLBB domain-containing protein [Planctomycetaceae bacterium]|jgi:hypothetical protein|nr:SLBB domain-containing protein [Planctomycetaceae bacterium]